MSSGNLKWKCAVKPFGHIPPISWVSTREPSIGGWMKGVAVRKQFYGFSYEQSSFSFYFANRTLKFIFYDRTMVVRYY